MLILIQINYFNIRKEEWNTSNKLKEQETDNKKVENYEALINDLKNQIDELSNTIMAQSKNQYNLSEKNKELIKKTQKVTFVTFDQNNFYFYILLGNR